MLNLTRRFSLLLLILVLAGGVLGGAFLLLEQTAVSRPAYAVAMPAAQPTTGAITSTVYVPVVRRDEAQLCYYVETDDAVVVEIESAAAVDQWQLEDSFGEAGVDFGGSGYYVWRGPDLLATPGVAILSYPISLSKQATYRLNIHNWHPDNPSEMNDVWVRLDDGPWIKGFSNRIDQWTWDFNFEHGGLGPADFPNVSPGLHTLQLSARSHGFALDRFALSAVGMGQLVTWPESPCVVP